MTNSILLSPTLEHFLFGLAIAAVVVGPALLITWIISKWSRDHIDPDN
jgi:hypothetical protein